MIKDAFTRRFAELEEAFKAIPRQSGGMGGSFFPNGNWRGWATSALNLVRACFGESSPHYSNFTDLYMKCDGGAPSVLGMNAIFLGAKDDFEGGYVFDVDLRVSGEVFGDFVALARQALSEGQKDVAAVLASAALEDALKRFALANKLDVDGKDMQNVINALKGAGLVAGPQKSLLETMPKLRNAALHAEWSKLSDAEVGSMLGFVEQFLLMKFSG